MSVQIFDQTLLLAFWLSFTRWVTLVFQLPIFDQMNTPGIVKILTSLMITYAFFPISKASVLADITAIGTDHMMYMTFVYTVIGLVTGFLLKVIMNLFVSAGSLMTQQIGFASIRYFDPSAGAQIGPMEKLIQLTVVMMIFVSGALLPMFKGGLISFQTISMMNLSRLFTSPEYFLMLFKSLFLSAILLSSPLLFTNLLLYMTMGIVARTVPQMNILMVSFVVNIGIGMLVFLSASQEIFTVAYKMYVEKLGAWFQYITL